MRKLMAVAAIALSAMFVVPAFAQVSTSGLSEEQTMQLKAQAAKLAADNVTAEAKAKAESIGTNVVAAITDPKTVSTWGNQAAIAAEGLANALGIAAKTVGISVNEFAASPAGKLVVLGIGIKLFGPMAVSLLVSLAAILGTLWLIRFGVRSMCGVATTETHPKKILWGLIEYTKVTRTYKSINELYDTPCFGAWLFILIGFVAIFVIALNA